MAKYLVNEEETTKEKFESILSDSIDAFVDEEYDNLLDECYDIVKIGCCEFTASEILRECNPIAYRCGMSDEQSAQYSDAMYFLERGEDVEFDGNTFRIEE